jgi:hypothetical protein
MKQQTMILLGLGAAAAAYLLWKEETPGAKSVTLVAGQSATFAAKAGDMITVHPPAGYSPPVLATGNLIASGANTDGSVTFTAPANPTATINAMALDGSSAASLTVTAG